VGKGGGNSAGVLKKRDTRGRSEGAAIQEGILKLARIK